MSSFPKRTAPRTYFRASVALALSIGGVVACGSAVDADSDDDPDTGAGDAGDATGDGAGQDAGPSRDASCANDASCSADASIGTISLVAGGDHTCALLPSQTVKCWGANDGNLGVGDTNHRGDDPGEMGAALPAVDLGPETPASIAVSPNHACALLVGGRVKCWGYNIGALGLGDSKSRGEGPGEMGAALPAVDLGTSRTAVQVVTGRHHTCALLDNGGVKCWGLNSNGRLGLGDTVSRGDEPGQMGDALPEVQLGTGRKVISLAAGDEFTCARFDDGAIKCWGSNTFGCLGLGDTNHRGDDPGEMGNALPTVNFGAGRKVTQLATSADASHACAILDNGALKCWGRSALGLGNTSSMGDNPSEMGDALPAVDLGKQRKALRVAVGAIHTCVILDDGSVKCWGDNYYGNLGLGDDRARGGQTGEMGDSLPIVDLGPGSTVQLTAGAGHTCAVLDDGAIKCWGDNDEGQLGLGDTTNRGNKPGQMGAALPALALD